MLAKFTEFRQNRSKKFKPRGWTHGYKFLWFNVLIRLSLATG